MNKEKDIDYVTSNCSQLYAAIHDNIFEGIKKMWSPSSTDPKDNSILKTFVANGLQISQSEIPLLINLKSKAWGETRETLQDLAIAKLLNAEYVKYAKSLGLSAESSAFAVADAKLMAQNQFFISSQMAMEYMPLIKSLVHLFAVVACVLLLILAIMFASPLYWKTFITLNIWVVIWTPLICVLDYFVMLRAERLIDIMGSSNIADLEALISNYQGEILFAGNMLWTVPVLAFAIASGSAQGFVQFASTLGQTFASSAMTGARQVVQTANAPSIRVAEGKDVWDINAGNMRRLTTKYNAKTGATREYTDTFVDNKATEFNIQSGYGNAKFDSNSNIIGKGFDSNSVLVKLQEAHKVTESQAHEMAHAAQKELMHAKSVGDTRNILMGLGYSKNEADQIAASVFKSATEGRTHNDTDGRDEKTDRTEAGSTGNNRQGGKKAELGIGGNVNINAKKTSSTKNLADRALDIADKVVDTATGIVGSIMPKASFGLSAQQDVNIKSDTAYKTAKGTNSGENISETHSAGETQSKNHSGTTVRGVLDNLSTNQLYNFAKNHSFSDKESQSVADKYSKAVELSKQFSTESMAASLNQMADEAGLSGLERREFIMDKIEEIGKAASTNDLNSVRKAMGLDEAKISSEAVSKQVNGSEIDKMANDFNKKYSSANASIMAEQKNIKSNIPATPKLDQPYSIDKKSGILHFKDSNEQNQTIDLRTAKINSKTGIVTGADGHTVKLSEMDRLVHQQYIAKRVHQLTKDTNNKSIDMMEQNSKEF